ncbi:Kdo domain containing protein [Flavobacterium sp. CYK-4]|uniref:lipopolysaccharide kinase InaA family protein n=1 Tax=Flavobacterium lotistagni TaxID=2709660 RepID=UPI00140C670D|nr:lipopolysaccharide kinase InaA family protein [Flavobacterium lotistagni]NHM07940.1 Kdo domain containing protein [Flavobacterium lotistagni]
MHSEIHSQFRSYTPQLIEYVEHFDTSGTLFVDGQRNKIKLFELDGKTLNIKSFKVPNLINRIAYRYLRKSKARRSYEFANRLLQNGIGTPQPIAYFEKRVFFGFGNSYYVSEQLTVDLTFRELVENPDFPDWDNILCQFMAFCFELHEKGIEFLDHSPGNTLIKKAQNGKYDFYLVDLNRMNFHQSMNFESRMKNLSHLTPKKEMVKVMSAFYAAHYRQKSEAEIAERLWFYTDDFQKKFQKKIELKKRFLLRK